ncbi:MAG: hypothetical protein IPM71_06405 [Bacteroidota bacterium]|nr:MAG: hypothetical protein IPM71_06405 [Bacteroidota bacterium]
MASVRIKKIFAGISEKTIGLLGFIISVVAITQTCRQAKLNQNAVNAEYRPYVWVEPGEYGLIPTYDTKDYFVYETIDIPITFINDGKTPAYPIYVNCNVTIYDLDQFDFREYIRNADREKKDIIVQKFFRTDSNNPLTKSIDLRNPLDYDKENKVLFSDVILKDHPFSIVFRRTAIKSKKIETMFLHIYIVYKDAFKNYHELYHREKLYLNTVSSQPLSPVIEIKTYSSNPIPERFRKSKY